MLWYSSMGFFSVYFPLRKLLRFLLVLLVGLAFIYLGLLTGFIKPSDRSEMADIQDQPAERMTNKVATRRGVPGVVPVLPSNGSKPITAEAQVVPPNQQKVPNATFVYFTVPKCGSRTLFYLVSNLKERNGWGQISALTKLVKEKRSDRTSMVQKYVSNATQPSFLYVDTSFVPLTGIPGLVYISLIRDPLERFLSAYYFVKSGDSIQGPDARSLGGKYGRDYFSRCQKSHRNDTCFGHWLGKTIHPRFCGATSQCNQMARKTIEKAKKTATERFAVVGLLEEFDNFLKLLEKKFPLHFGGLHELYKKSEAQEFVSKVKTKNKDRPRPDIIEKMKEDMKLDYEFYNFVKDHFHKQLQEMEIT